MREERLNQVPSLPRLYGKALLGALPGGGGGDLPALELSVSDVSVDTGHLAAYDRVCGFRLADRLPPTYLHVFAFPVAMRLMTDRSFPLPLIGLVHVRNRIVQERPVLASEAVSLRVRAEGLRSAARGTEVDLVAEAEAGGERVWSSTSTYLRRGGSGRGAEPGGGSAPPADEIGPGAPAVTTWTLGRDLGRRYARVSGDINPIHLHPLAARLFGFPRTIAHGMWSKARCLAALEGRLPDRFAVEVDFQKPVLLPSRVAFASARDGDGRRLELRRPGGGGSHLTGFVQPA